MYKENYVPVVFFWSKVTVKISTKTKFPDILCFFWSKVTVKISTKTKFPDILCLYFNYRYFFWAFLQPSNCFLVKPKMIYIVLVNLPIEYLFFSSYIF